MSNLADNTHNNTEPPAVTGGESKGRNKFLVAVLSAIFVVPLSVSGTAVALADIGRDIGADPVGQQWALNGFNVTFAASTLAWGSLADHIGRWRSFLTGGMIFIIGSAISFIAPNYVILDSARIITGLGAGAIFSVGSALLSVVFTGSERARVFAMMGAVAGLSLAFGPTFSGWITQTLSWRYIFAIHGTFLVISWLLMLTSRSLTRNEPRAEGTFDWPAALLFFGFTAAIVSSMVFASSGNLLNAPVLVTGVVGLGCLIGLIMRERNIKHPLLNFRLITQPRFLGVSLTVAIASFTFGPFVTYTPSLLQAAGGFSPIGSGLFMMFMTIPTLITPLIAGAFVARGASPRVALTVSAGLMILGTAVASIVSSSSIVLLASLMVVIGIGFGIHAGLVDNEGLASAPDKDAGMAAGWINTMRVGTEAIAVSLFGAVFVPSLAQADAAAASFRIIGILSASVGLVIGIISAISMFRPITESTKNNQLEQES